MKIPHEPDEILQHLPEKCQNCPHLSSCQSQGNFSCTESRYVVDVEIKTKVTEHQTLHPTTCPFGEVTQKAQFPENVTAYVQYGDMLTVLVGLLNTFGAISFERIHVILKGLLGVQLSTGTLMNMVKRCAKTVEPVVQQSKDYLIENGVNHYDETGIRVNGSTYWVHNSSSDKFASLLLRMKAQKERDLAYKKENTSAYHVHKFQREYDSIMKLADQQCPLPPDPPEKKRGRKKKGEERSLIERLGKLKDSVMRFFTDFCVPFDNNQAERDLRNCKTKIKVSGCFRSQEGAQDYLTISSYISTGKKHGISAFEALKEAFQGRAGIVFGKT